MWTVKVQFENFGQSRIEKEYSKELEVLKEELLVKREIRMCAVECHTKGWRQVERRNGMGVFPLSE